jgi:hypothetical protein
VPTPVVAPTTSPSNQLLNAAPVGSNIVVSGFIPRPNGLPRAGIYLINPQSWTAHLIDPTTPAWFTTGNSLITFTRAGQFRLPASWLTKGTGVTIYDATGTLRDHLYGTQAFEDVEATPRFDYAVLPTAQIQPAPGRLTTAQYQAQVAAVTHRELLFNPFTGRNLGPRTARGPAPFLIGLSTRTATRIRR